MKNSAKVKKICSRLTSAMLAASMVFTMSAVRIPVAKAATVEELASKFNANSYYDVENDNYLNYRIYVPEDYDSSKSYPLFLHFHGSGQRGDDNLSNIKEPSTLPLKLVEEENLKKYPCIIVVPQCPNDDYWVWEFGSDYPITRSMRSTYALIDDLLRAYNVDQNRMYVAGYSMGGTASWEVISRQPQRWAAAVPICGYTNYYINAKAQSMKDIPIKLYHAKDDPIMPSYYSRDIYNSLKAVGGNVDYYEIDSADHGAGWRAAFDDKDLLPWMFSQKNNGVFPEFVPPKPLDYDYLNDAIEKGGIDDIDRYTAGSAKIYLNAMSEAKSSRVDMMLTQDQLSEIADQLTEAKKQLKLAPISYTEINRLIVQAEKIDRKRYTEVSLARLDKALKEAKEIIANELASQKMINAKKNVLQTALSVLRPIPLDFTALNLAMVRAGSVNFGLYTAESIASLDRIIIKARDAMLSADLTQEEIDSLEREINNAVLNLKKLSAVVQSVKIGGGKLKMTVGGVKKLAAKISPAAVANTKISWSSGNKNVASVSNGRVTARAAGSTKITARAGSCRGSVTVSVLPKQPKKFTVKIKGKTVKFKIKKANKSYSTYVVCKKAGKGGYKKLCLTKKTTYAKKLAKGRYQFKACSYVKVKGKIYKSKFGKTVKYKIK